MELISDKTPQQEIVFLAVFFNLFALFLANAHWLGVVVLGGSLWHFTKHFIKVKEVYLCDNSIKVKRGKGFVEIPLSDIESVKTDHYFFRGCYKVRFNTKNRFGSYILFSGRLVPRKIFNNVYPGIKQLMNQVNT